MQLHMDAKAPSFQLEKSADGNSLKVCYISRARMPETKQMFFDMTAELVK